MRADGCNTRRVCAYIWMTQDRGVDVCGPYRYEVSGRIMEAPWQNQRRETTEND